MNENLNLVEILKDCPKGTKLYSIVYGNVTLESVEKLRVFTISYRTKSSEVFWVTSNGRLDAGYNGECTLFPSKEMRDWSKFKVKKHKFDTKTLKPFDKVLVRDKVCNVWRCGLFSHIDYGSVMFPFNCVGFAFKYCIPYNDDTKHLVGTTEEAPEYYRYYED